MKVKESITLEDDISRWVRTQGGERGTSAFINQILRETMKKHNSIYNKLEKIDSQINELNNQKIIVFKELEKHFEEGDKTEREKAKKELEEKKEKEAKKKKELKRLTQILEEKQLLNELMACEDIKDLWCFNKKLLEQNIKISEKSKVPGFGINLLSEIALFNGKNIPIAKLEEKEKEVKADIQSQSTKWAKHSKPH